MPNKKNKSNNLRKFIEVHATMSELREEISEESLSYLPSETINNSGKSSSITGSYNSWLVFEVD